MSDTISKFEDRHPDSTITSNGTLTSMKNYIGGPINPHQYITTTPSLDLSLEYFPYKTIEDWRKADIGHLDEKEKMEFSILLLAEKNIQEQLKKLYSQERVSNNPPKQGKRINLEL